MHSERDMFFIYFLLSFSKFNSLREGDWHWAYSYENGSVQVFPFAADADQDCFFDQDIVEDDGDVDDDKPDQ